MIENKKKISEYKREKERHKENEEMRGFQEKIFKSCTQQQQ